MNALGPSRSAEQNLEWFAFRTKFAVFVCDSLPPMFLRHDWEMEMGLLLDSLRLELGS